MSYNIRTSNYADIELLTTTFINNLKKHPEYISHGEIQMGVGLASHNADNLFVAVPSPSAEKMWRKYITNKIESDTAEVFIVEDKNGAILGFSVVDIEEDGADPFGMICDVLVLPEYRRTGIGSLLLKKDFEWLHSHHIKDVYLESGKDNHAAHAYFEHHKFEHVSNIYKLIDQL